jgi:2-dehydropantoate 2-reductase
MKDKKLNFLIIGTGVVGQIYGALLHKSGHNVTFVTREKYLNRFKDEGIKIQIGSHEKLIFKNCKFITQLKDTDRFDYIFLAIRTDQRDEINLLFDNLDLSESNLVICFPIWKNSTLKFMEKFCRCYYLFPGIRGLYKDHEIYFEKSTTKIGTLYNSSQEKALELCKILQNVGIPTKFSRDLVSDFQIILALGLPFLLGLSIKDYHLKEFAKDKKLRDLTVQAQKESLITLRAALNPVGFLGNIFNFMPIFIISFILRLSSLFVREFYREMLEIHFKKVHKQNIYLLKELCSFGKNKVKKENLTKLLSMSTNNKYCII